VNVPACCPKSSSGWRRGGEIAGWIIPSAVLILIPKCPAFLVAYLALLSGIGISFAGASILRSVVLVVSTTALVCLALKRLGQFAVKASRATELATEGERSNHII
jgi:hypothetical protein